MFGAFRWWKSAGQFLFAAVGGEGAGQTGWVYKHNGYGWSPAYRHGSANYKLYWLDVSSFDDGTTRLHFAIRSAANSSDGYFLERPLTNPLDSQTYTYQVDLAIDRPEYDLNLARIPKTLLKVYGDYTNLGEVSSNENYVNIDRWAGPGMIDAYLADVGNLDEDTLELSIASGAGVTAKSFAFRENLKRNASTTTTAPQSRGLEVDYYAKIPPLQKFTFLIDIDDSAELTGRGTEEVHTNLFLARDSNILITLQYGAMTSTYVEIKQMTFGDSFDMQSGDVVNTAAPRGGQCLIVAEEVMK